MSGMTLGQLRRSNLLTFINQRHAGNKAAFADFIGVKRPQVYRYFPKKGKADGPVLSEAIVQVVSVDAASFKPRALPDGFRERLQRLENAAPEI